MANSVFADNEPREAICSVVSAQDNDYMAWISSSCSDFVEVEPNVFQRNESACLTAMMQVKVVAKNEAILENIKASAEKKELQCFIGVFKSGVITVDQIENISFFENN